MFIQLGHRLIGMETEGGIYVQLSDSSEDFEDFGTTYERLRLPPVVNEFLPNGGRLYRSGRSLEYSTPECQNPLVLAQFHHQVAEIFADIQRNTPLPAELKAWYFPDRRDRQGRSWGTHENYLTLREVPLEMYGSYLAPYLATRPLLFGTGWISPEGTFFLSSRAPLIEKLSSWNTIKDRGLINERDTPLVPEHLRSKYRRFHYIASEANARSDLTALKVGSMILMLTMLEAGWSLDHLRLKDPVNALAQCNSNPYGFLELDNGSSHSPLKIQWLLLQEACRFVEKVGHDLPEWVFWVLDRWELCLCSLEKKSILDVKENWIEWRAKQYLLQTTARDLKPIEQVYATEFIGLGEEVERAKKLEATRMLAPHCIADRDAPPDSVRAQERGKIVREILEKGEENRKVDWVKETNQNKGTDLSFPEPELACL